MRNLAVTVCLNKPSVIVACFDPLPDNVRLVNGAYFRGVWSKLRINDGGIEYSTTRFDAGREAYLPVLLFRKFLALMLYKCVTNPILWNKFSHKKKISRSILFKCSTWFWSINACAVAFGMTVSTTPPLYLEYRKYPSLVRTKNIIIFKGAHHN